MNMGHWTTRSCLAMVLMLTALTAWGSGVRELRKQVEASMLLTGSVEVNRDGSLRSFQLDQPEKVDPVVRDFVLRNIKDWTFRMGPLPDGISADATIRNAMSVLVVAKPAEDGTFALRLAAANFSPVDPDPRAQLGWDRKDGPVYPRAAAYARVEGKVFLLVKVAADGLVDDVIAEQVNLGVVARNEKEMERWRRMFAASALRAARLWTFTVPTLGERAHRPFNIVRVPVSYILDPTKQKGYGEWVPYIPGPRHPNQWERADDNPGFAPDALAADGAMYSNDGLRLKTPLQGAVDGG